MRLEESKSSMVKAPQLAPHNIMLFTLHNNNDSKKSRFNLSTIKLKINFKNVLSKNVK